MLGVSLPRPVNVQNPSARGLTFEPHHFKSMDGLQLEAWHRPVVGEGPSILLFPGYGGAKADLLPIAAEFHQEGAEVWLVDFRGCGGSAGSMTTLGFHEAGDVAAAAEFASIHSGPKRPLLLYGTSMGAAAVLRATSLGWVKPTGLILECPFDRLLSTAGNRFHAMGLPAFPIAHFLVFWGGVQLGFNGFAHNPVEYARAIRCPSLLLVGERDPRVTPEQAAEIGRNLGTQGRLVRFPELGHQSYLAAQPKRWREEVFGFVRATVGASTPVP